MGRYKWVDTSADLRPLQVCGSSHVPAKKAADLGDHEVCGRRLTSRGEGMHIESVKTATATHGATSDAVISADGKYRYKLGRYWSPKAPPVVWIMLNPSTADAVENDPTIRRCVSFAKRWGFGGIEVYNLFALRSPHPSTIETALDPIGPDNDSWLMAASQSGRKIIAAWGSCRTQLRIMRATQVIEVLVRGGGPAPATLGLTKTGRPKHPLYVRGDAQLVPLPYHSMEF